MLTSHQRTRLLTIARLRVATTDAERERDVRDAGSLATIARGVRGLRADLAERKVDAVALEILRQEAEERAGRVMVERIWERPRRQIGSHPVLNDKYAFGGAWTPAAVELTVQADETGLLGLRPQGPARAPEQWNGNLELEHVVPAKTIYRLVGAASAAGASDRSIADMLHEIAISLVVASTEARAPQNMAEDDVLALEAHYDGTSPLEPDPLFARLWSRYLGASGPGLDLATITTLDDAIALSRPPARSTCRQVSSSTGVSS